MKANLLITTATFIVVACNSVFGQLTVNSGQTAQQLAELLAGPNIEVFNASFTGGVDQKGSYTYTGTAFQSTGGVILSTGDIVSAIGPNVSESTTGGVGGPGDQALTNISGFPTNDAVELRFDFEVQSDMIEFEYIFASEEYNEYVGSTFNDVFAFFISGPGIVGEENIAVVPTTQDGVTINNINNDSYWQFYTDNQGGMATNDISFDGYTTKMKATKSGLTTCSVYTLRLVIADVSDGAYDSGVFLQSNSLVQGNVDIVSNTPLVDNTALEGCTQASFTFNLDDVLDYDWSIDFIIGGSAINGVDYQTIDDQVTIPAGQTSATIYIDAFADGIDEGQENIYLIYAPTVCAEMDTIELFIDDNVPIDYSLLGINLSCFEDNSGQIDATITGGTSPYVLDITDEDGNLTTVSSDDLPLTGLAAGTYQILVDDAYGCAGDAIVVSGDYNGGAIFLPDGNGQVYSTQIPITGFNGATITSPDQIQSICVNMEHSALGEVEIKLIAPDGTELILKERFNNSDGGHTNLGEPVANGPVDGGNQDTTPGIGYDYCFTSNAFYGTMVEEQSNYFYNYTDVTGTDLQDHYLPAGSYTPYEAFDQLVGVPIDGNWTLWIKDHNPQDNGWVFSWNISMTSPNTGDIIILTEPNPLDISQAISQPACGANDGGIDITVTGDNPPFTFLWSDNSTNEDLSNVPAGIYSVEITDNNDCVFEEEFSITNISAPVPTGVMSNPSCHLSSDGQIDLTVTEAVDSYLWSTNETTEDISNLSAGTYSVEVHYSSGCVATEEFTLTTPDVLNVSETIINEHCGDMEGEIHLVATGGDGNYTANWSNGMEGLDITDLVQGAYTLTLTDGNNCSYTETFNITNIVGNCTPNCDLEITYSSITDEFCGNGQGSISLLASSSHGPIGIEWSNNVTTLNNPNLSEGNYTINLTDEEGCSVSETYTVYNNTSLNVALNSSSNEICGQSNGSINVDVSGGAGNYTYLWSNNATTQDLNNVPAGTYTLTVTDQSNCSKSITVTITNESTFSLSFQYVTNEFCGDGTGSIDINVTPNGNYTYQWNTGQPTQDLTGLSAGTYSCTISDLGGCQVVTPTYTVINESGNLNAWVIDTDNEICGNQNGEITVGVSGGTNYTFDWSNNATTQNLTNIAAGSYSCIVSDDSGCTVNLGPITITNQPGTLSANEIITADTCSQSIGSIVLDIQGGTEPFDILWDNTATNDTISNLSAGFYSYTVTDANGCSINNTLNVPNVSNQLAINGVVTDATCGNTDGAIDITATGATGNLTYTWSNTASTEDLINIPTGNYQVTVEDQNGCIANASFVVNGELIPSSTTIVDESCGYSNGSIAVTFANTNGLTYNWSNNATTATNSNLAAGSYTLNVTNASFCSYTETFTVGTTPCLLLCTDSESSDLTGTVYDSGGPDFNYASNEDCDFLIHPVCADTIYMNMPFVQIAIGDTLRIYDGTSSQGPLLLQFTNMIQANVSIMAVSGNAYIHLTSNNAGNGQGFTLDWNTVVNTAVPTASFTISNTTPFIGEPVTFTNTSSQTNMTSWDFNEDGIEDNSELSASYSFDTPGTHTIQLIVTNCLGADTITQQVVVPSSPSIAIEENINASITSCDPVDVSFYIYNDGTEDLDWNSSDVIPSSGTIVPGDSALVTTSVQPQPVAGTFTHSLLVFSNDPVIQTSIVDIIVNQSISCVPVLCTDSQSTSETGLLYDSGGPTGNYSNNEDCSFLIQPDCADNLDITLSNVSIGINDTLFIYNGDSENSPLFTELTNISFPSWPFTLQSGMGYIVLVTDGVNTSGGFELEWQVNNYTNPPVANFNISNTTPNVGEVVTFVNTSTNSSEISWDFDGDGIEDANTSPAQFAFPSSGTYDVQLIVSNCAGADTITQQVFVDPSAVINTLNPIDVTNNTCEDLDTSFYIYNLGDANLAWSSTQTLPTNGTILPGDSALVNVTLPQSYVIGTSTVAIQINSNDPNNPTYSVFFNVTQTQSCTSTLCSDVMSTDNSGSLTDSGGPLGNYSDNENCTYLIQPSCAESITLNLDTFLIEQNYDFLTVYDGTDASGTLLGTYTGYGGSVSVTATSGSMFITFTSDNSINDAGFEATWTSVDAVDPVADFSFTDPVGVGQSITFTNTSTSGQNFSWDFNEDGTIDSNSEDGNYTYTAPGTYTVMLIAANCLGADTSYQTIEVVDGNAELFIPMTTYQVNATDCSGSQTSFYMYNTGTINLNWSCADLAPSSGTIAPGDSTLVTYSSDGYPYAGTYNETISISSNSSNSPTQVFFLIVQSFDCFDVLCNATMTTEGTGVLFDSGGPSGNYSDNENCGYLIQPTCANTITVTINQYDLETNYDFLNIYDGIDNSGTLLSQLTGLGNNVILTGTSGSIYIELVSDFSVNNSGFDLTWETDYNLPAPDAQFSVSATNVFQNEQVIFTNNSVNATSYSWDFDGDGTFDSNLADGTYSYTNTGVYNATLYAYNNCGMTDSITVQIVVGVDGIEEFEASTVQIYPNPSATGQFFIKGLNETEEFVVVDLTGKQIAYDAIQKNGQIQLSLQDVPRGVYILINKDKQYKLIKN